MADVGTLAALLVVPVSDGSALLHVTFPIELIDPIAEPDEQLPLTRTWSCPVLARTIPTEPGWIFLYVTALLRSCAVPTLLLGSCVAA